MNLATLEAQVVVAITLAALLALATVALWRRWRVHRARRQVIRAIEGLGSAALRDVLVPDGSGGQMHLDFLLLTARGLLVIDLRDVAGVVFGGEHMREWTVMNGTERSTFLNPIEPLYDRVAAVRLLAGEVPVEGRVVFTDRGRFPKGRPPQVTMLADLAAELPAPPEGGDVAQHPFREAWEAVVRSAERSPLARR